MIATLYPKKIEQPNANKSSGLAGKCLKEIRRDKSVHNGNCRTQKDPKYHHAWSNTSELKTGGVAQCGRKSSYHCSHATYYSIKGYRNTCPIAGVNGTYTQPAALRLYFDLLEKNIVASSQIKSVKVNISHRCTGVDVANDKEYDSWGPNFSGFKTYPNREVLTVKIGNKTKTYNENPPLSKSKFNKITLTFNDVSYSDLSHIDIQYGNNLSSNPGNIYIKDVSITVDYLPGTQYLEGKQSTNEVFLATEDRKLCRTPITFTMEAGYKNGTKKINPNSAPKKIQNDIKVSKLPDGLTLSKTIKNDGRTVVFTGTDSSNIEAIKTVIFKINGTKITKKFQYEAKRRSKPDIELPDTIQKNTISDGKEGIVVKNGCAYKLTVYDESIDGSSIELTLDPTKQDNLLVESERIKFYNWLSTLSCGEHTLLFRRDNEINDYMISKVTKIVGATYRVFFFDGKKMISSLNLTQNKSENTKIKIVFEKTRNFVSNPTFTILNPTFGLEEDNIPTQKRVNETEVTWTPNKEGGEYDLTVGTYLPGTYNIIIKEPNNCSDRERILKINIEPTHKQYYDEVFIRGEDSTAFDYEYLVALEGDNITEPIYVRSREVGASYEDIKICTTPQKLAQLTNQNTIPLTITNTSNNDIQNLLLELNAIVENEDGDLEVTTTEWLEEGGMFYNFREAFKGYNDEGINRITEIKNLTEDDDFIDEEDVYLNIKKLAAKESITVNIPFGSHIQKEAYLQILFAGEPMLLYNKDDCSDQSKTFDKIFLKVYDSLLTEMTISGDIDILSLSDPNCPLKCFKTEEGIKYRIKNIDTQEMDEVSRVTIKNDPRLVPYQYKTLKDSEPKPISELSTNVFYKNTVEEKDYLINGTKITIETKFDNYERKTYSGTTNEKGIATIYVPIPKSIGGTFTSEEFFNTLDVELEPSSYDSYSIKVIDDYITYYPGDVIPLMIKITYHKKMFVNEISFIPNIKEPGMFDEITVYYKVCNLKRNRGILKTSFETSTYNLIENKVEEDILFGVETNLEVYSQLKQVVVEQHNYNRLWLTVINKDRFNKDIKIKISEKKSSLKYKYYYSSLEIGELLFEEDDIVWNIPSLQKDVRVKGYIDLEAENVGLSELSIEKEDFLTNLNIEFDRKNCKCGEEIDDE